MDIGSAKARELLELALSGQASLWQEEELAILREHRSLCIQTLLSHLAIEMQNMEARLPWEPIRLEWCLRLLAFFQEENTFPALLRLHGLMDVLLEGISPSFIFSCWEGLVVSTIGSRWERLWEEMHNPDVEDSLQECCFSALAVLVAEGRAPRDRVVELLRQLFGRILAGEVDDFLVVLYAIDTAIQIGPRDLLEEIREVFGLSLVSEEHIQLQEVLEAAEQTTQDVLEDTSKAFREYWEPLAPLLASEQDVEEEEEVALLEEEVGTLIEFSLEEREGSLIEVGKLVSGYLPHPEFAHVPKRDLKRFFALCHPRQYLPQKALEISKELVEKYPHIPAFHDALRTAYSDLDRRQDSLRVLKEMVRRFPEHLLSKIVYAYYLLRRGEPGRVAELFSYCFSLTKLVPHRKLFHVIEWLGFSHVSGWYFVQMGMFEQANRCLESIGQIAPDSTEYEDLKSRIHKELLVSPLDDELRDLGK